MEIDDQYDFIYQMLCKKMHIRYFALEYVSTVEDKIFTRIYANYGNGCKPFIWFYPIDKRKKIVIS